jgi:ADP-ribose pyrophosphatase YjhB (NUDIX family)
MGNELSNYLSRLMSANRELWDWGEIQLQTDLYLTQRLPPQKFVTSLRGIMFKDDMVLVAHNDREEHIMPGGRRERGETYLETLQRECLEETCYDIEAIQPIAVIHCQHLTPKPDNYKYPYPDFCQIIYAAKATQHHADRVIEDDYVTGVEFRPIEIVQKMPLTSNQHILLQTALEEKLF